MPFHDRFPKANTLIIILFFSLWAYTEIAEYLARDNFKDEVVDFMTRGDRFTAEDGAALKERVKELEKCCAED